MLIVENAKGREYWVESKKDRKMHRILLFWKQNSQISHHLKAGHILEACIMDHEADYTP